jgi:hypothetical protein
MSLDEEFSEPPGFPRLRLSESPFDWRNLDNNSTDALIEVCQECRIPVANPVRKQDLIDKIVSHFDPRREISSVPSPLARPIRPVSLKHVTISGRHRSVFPVQGKLTEYPNIPGPVGKSCLESSAFANLQLGAIPELYPNEQPRYQSVAIQTLEPPPFPYMQPVPSQTCEAPPSKNQVVIVAPSGSPSHSMMATSTDDLNPPSGARSHGSPEKLNLKAQARSRGRQIQKPITKAPCKEPQHIEPGLAKEERSSTMRNAKISIMGLLSASLSGDSDGSDEDLEIEWKSGMLEEKLQDETKGTDSIVIGLKLSWIQSLFVVILLVILMGLVYRLH